MINMTYVTVFLLNMTGHVPNMIEYVTHVTGFVLKLTKIVQNITVLVQDSVWQGSVQALKELTCGPSIGRNRTVTDKHLM